MKSTAREIKLYSMKGPELIKEADKLGVKVKCNKTRTKLVEAKADLVERILAFEAEKNAQPEAEIEEPIIEEPIVETENQPELELKGVEEIPAPTPKRGASIEWNGKSQNICKWAEEL